MRIGLYGGSFNPVHHGHLVTARFAGEALGLERVILLPSASPPHKDPRAADFAPASARRAMLELAIRGDGLLEVGDDDLTRDGPTYTVETVEGYRRSSPLAEPFWIVGADSVEHLHTWHRVADLMALCQVVVVCRPDAGPDWGKLRSRLASVVGRRAARGLAEGAARYAVDVPGFAVSATLVRKRVRAGLPIRYLVPETVASYIAATGLYGPDFRV